jgi:signal transduction histidine kinase
MLNALDAMAEIGADRRLLQISTASLEPGGIEIVVRDGGTGISPEVFERLFEPFATTKPTGMGLGLSIARSIVAAHRGRIWAESTADGAAFHICLPAVDARDAQEVSSHFARGSAIG